MKITRLKIQGFRTINRGFDCTLSDMTIFVGRNNAGKSCAVRALNLFFNHSDDYRAFLPHVRINPESERKKRFSIIIMVWLSNLPDVLNSKYRRYLTPAGELPVRLYFNPTDNSIIYSCFKRGASSTTYGKGEINKEIITDISQFISLRVIPETRDLAREFQTELGHGFQSLKQSVLNEAESKSSKEAKSYKTCVETIIHSQLVHKINSNLGSAIPGHSIKIGNIEQISFSRMVLGAIIDSLPIYALNDDSDGVSIDQMGAGFQSAVLVSLYRTVAQLEGKKLILCVEEPEIHLDSHAQRYCYHHWKQQVDSENDLNQVLITSHSAFLIDEASPAELVLVKRDNSGCTKTTQFRDSFFSGSDIDKLSTKTLGLHNTDVFFSCFVVLVEGEGDTVAYRGFLELLLKSKKSSFGSLSLAGISVIDCGGKDGIRALANILTHLEIPHIIIFDRDVIQKSNPNNLHKIQQRVIERTYLKELSNNFFDQRSLFPSDSAFNKVRDEITSKLKAGTQSGYPQSINSVLGQFNILIMRTEHETDILDKRNIEIIAELFSYDLTEYLNQSKSEELTLNELKMYNQKALKKAFITAKVVSKTDSFDQVPSIYAKICNEIYSKVKTAGILI
ncbi:MAG: AAA family ATPase [Gammaproteobacteria bacterium]